jgi:hypothetical protein
VFLGSTQPLTEMSTRNPSWRWRRPVRRANNLTAFKCRLSRNSGVSTSWNPKGLSKPVAGNLYLLLPGITTENLHSACTVCPRASHCPHNTLKSFASTECTDWFLGAFARPWKATISFVISVCLSVRMEQLGFYWTDFYAILYFILFFLNLSTKSRFY